MVTGVLDEICVPFITKPVAPDPISSPNSYLEVKVREKVWELGVKYVEAAGGVNGGESLLNEMSLAGLLENDSVTEKEWKRLVGSR